MNGIDKEKMRQYLEDIDEPEYDVQTSIKNYLNCYAFDPESMKGAKNYWNSQHNFIDEASNDLRSNHNVYKQLYPLRTILSGLIILALILVVAFFMGYPYPIYSGVLLNLYEYATGVYENILELLSYIKSFI